MSEEKQSNPEAKRASDVAGKKINHDILKWVVIGLAGLAVVFLIFGAGMVVGGMKAKFSYRWAESYHKNFAGPQDGFFGDWQSRPPLPGDFIEGHGAFGEIIQISDTDIVVKGRGDVEKVIIISEDTAIQKGRGKIKKEELRVGDQIVIIGSPNKEGQIEAKLVRVFNGQEKRLPYKRPTINFF